MPNKSRACAVSVAEALDHADSILSSPGIEESSASAALLGAAAEIAAAEQAPTTGTLFSTYLVSPTYFADTDEMLLVKLSTAKGEPFYLLDQAKQSKPLVCGTTEVFLTAYNAESACVDECDGMPAVHVVPDCDAAAILSKLTCSPEWFAGLVFVSNVSIQFYYRSGMGSPEMSSTVFRVANNAEGQVEARDIRGAVTCDYPVPYLMVDYNLFSEGSNTCAIVEFLAKANASLIDALCRTEYVALHQAEVYPDILENTLTKFMERHSHLIKSLLDAQIQGLACDDAFVRRQRKSEIDTLVRLMMREADLIASVKTTLDELIYVQKAVEQCPQPKKPKLVEEDTGAACGVEEEPAAASEEFSDKVSEPMSGCDPGIADSALLRSPSSSSESCDED